jgi:hypothetical protein
MLKLSRQRYDTKISLDFQKNLFLRRQTKKSLMSDQLQLHDYNSKNNSEYEDGHRDDMNSSVISSHPTSASSSIHPLSYLKRSQTVYINRQSNTQQKQQENQNQKRKNSTKKVAFNNLKDSDSDNDESDGQKSRRRLSSLRKSSSFSYKRPMSLKNTLIGGTSSGRLPNIMNNNQLFDLQRSYSNLSSTPLQTNPSKDNRYKDLLETMTDIYEPKTMISSLLSKLPNERVKNIIEANKALEGKNVEDKQRLFTNYEMNLQLFESRLIL